MTTIAEISDQLERVNNHAHELWATRADGVAAAKLFAREDKIRVKLKRLDEIRDRLYAQLWDLYYDDPDALEVIDERKDPWGRIRIRYCDGQFHFVTNKKDELIYGYECDCE